MNSHDHVGEELVEIATGLYSKADAEKIETWVELISVMLLFDHSHVEELKAATRALGAKAQSQYVQLESGGDASLEVRDCADFLDPFPGTVRLGFVVITGEVLFTSIDGPNAGAVVLCEALDQMHTAMTTGGGE